MRLAHARRTVVTLTAGSVLLAAASWGILAATAGTAAAAVAPRQGAASHASPSRRPTASPSPSPNDGLRHGDTDANPGTPTPHTHTDHSDADANPHHATPTPTPTTATSTPSPTTPTTATPTAHVDNQRDGEQRHRSRDRLDGGHCQGGRRGGHRLAERCPSGGGHHTGRACASASCPCNKAASADRQPSGPCLPGNGRQRAGRHDPAAESPAGAGTPHFSFGCGSGDSTPRATWARWTRAPRSGNSRCSSPSP